MSVGTDPDTRPDGLPTVRVFRVGNRPLILIAAMIALTALVPASSLHELITTGTIDFEAVSQTRRKIPIWFLYATAWPIFLITVWSTRSILRYVFHRDMFSLGSDGITIRGQTLSPDEVQGFRHSFLRGHVLRSRRGEFPIHPWMVKGGVEALAEALPHIPPLKKGEVPGWLLD
jgi:hypothetical protein